MKEELIEFIKEELEIEGEIHENSHFIDELEMDSMDVADIYALFVKKRYLPELKPDVFKNAKTDCVADVVKFVQEQLS